MGEEFYPPNGKWLSPNFEKTEIRNLRKQNEFSPKIKFGGYESKVIKREQTKMIEKPVKYIVPGICDRDAKRESSQNRWETNFLDNKNFKTLEKLRKWAFSRVFCV